MTRSLRSAQGPADKIGRAFFLTMNLANLIRRGKELDQRIKEDSEELRKIRTQIIAEGVGRHEGACGSEALVIQPNPNLNPDADAIEVVRKLIPAVQFSKLFRTVTTTKPVDAFRQVAAAVVSPKVLPKVIAACEKPSAAQVKFS